MKTYQVFFSGFGCLQIGRQYQFTLEAEVKAEAFLRLYDKKQNLAASVDLKDYKIGEGIYSLVLDPQRKQYASYDYLIDGRVMADPWGKSFPYELYPERAALRDRVFDWEDDKRPGIPEGEVIACALSVRGATMGSDVSEELQGTFLGLCKRIDLLKELGVNRVILMPVNEAAEESFWGYGPGYYMAPARKYYKNDVTELMEMVKQFHKSGIEVILEIPFEKKYGERTVLQVLSYLAGMYHLDGFLVNPYLHSFDVLRYDPLLYGLKILKKDDRFQNNMRQFLRGDEGQIHGVMWNLLRKSQDEGSYNYMTNPNGMTLYDVVSYNSKHNEVNGRKNQDGPAEDYSFNYGIEGFACTEEIQKLRLRQMKNAFLLLMLSKGSPCLLAGDWVCNSQSGNNNPFNQDNEIGWTSFTAKSEEEDLYEWLKELIAFRKENPAFSYAETKKSIRGDSRAAYLVTFHGDEAFVAPDKEENRSFGLYLRGSTDGYYVVFNMEPEEKEIAFPGFGEKCHWTKILDTDHGCMKEEVSFGDQRFITVPGRTIEVYYREG